jgi:hypothetical protein
MWYEFQRVLENVLGNGLFSHLFYYEYGVYG